MKLVVCKYEECSVEFERKKHNQIYHSDECRRLSTNKRLMDRYYEKKRSKARKLEHSVYCACGTVISRYNESGRCFNCIKHGMVDNQRLLADLLEG